LLFAKEFQEAFIGLGAIFVFEFLLLLVMPIDEQKCRPTPELLQGYHHKVDEE